MLGLPKPRGEASASRLGQRSPRPAPLSGKYQSIAGISHCPLSTHLGDEELTFGAQGRRYREGDRKSTRLNSSHVAISYAVFCLKKKTHNNPNIRMGGEDYGHSCN